MNIGEDNVLTTHRSELHVPDTRTPMHIHLLGDIHFDSPTCDKKAFKKDIATIRKQHDEGVPYAIILMGDYLDRCSFSERSKIARGSLHESTQANMDRDALRDITEFLDTIWFTKDHVLGVIQGNHYWRFLTGDLSGKSSDQYIAEKLGVKWLGFLSYLRLDLFQDNRGSRKPLDIVVCHGSKAGGKLAGTSINQVADLKAVFPAADVYALGHNHQAGVAAVSSMFVMTRRGKSLETGLDIQEKKQLLVRTGSYLKAYEQDTPSYAVKSLYRPATLGHAELLVQATRNGSKMGHQISAVV